MLESLVEWTALGWNACNIHNRVASAGSARMDVYKVGNNSTQKQDQRRSNVELDPYTCSELGFPGE